MFPSRYVFPPVLIVRFCGSTLLHRVLISVNRSPKLNCHVERGRNKKRAIRAISPEIHVFRFFSISPYAHLPLLSVSQKKKMHSRDVASFPSFFFFSLHPLCTFARKSINEIGSIKKRRVILLDTVTCNSFFFSFSFNSILKRFSRILVEV